MLQFEGRGRLRAGTHRTMVATSGRLAAVSRRRRVLVAVVAVLVLVVAVVVGVRAFAGRGGTVDPAAHPPQDVLGPVLLVPGYGGSQASLQGLAARIAATGRTTRVIALPGDGTGDLSAQVTVLDAAVDAALAAGAPSVDLIGYSAGGVVAGLWVARDDGPAKARRVVTVGSPLGGTTLAAVGSASVPDACPIACRQLAPGSAELTELARADVGHAVPWLSVWSTDDQTATPPDTARLPGAVNVAVQDTCSGARVDHGGLPNDPAVVGLVLRALGVAPIAAGGDCATLRAAGAR
ncbi:esterase/lipase family protein [Pseudonocardia sp. GCM10023141]|uniref:esterase/lipase family protein n=1 Tax=Pseudonocardia sp. GCM10023141 TaxID=3252653 RepID=UPI0036190112